MFCAGIKQKSASALSFGSCLWIFEIGESFDVKLKGIFDRQSFYGRWKCDIEAFWGLFLAFYWHENKHKFWWNCKRQRGWNLKQSLNPISRKFSIEWWTFNIKRLLGKPLKVVGCYCYSHEFKPFHKTLWVPENLNEIHSTILKQFISDPIKFHF